MIEKNKNTLLNIKFRLSDLLLAIGFIPMIVFLMYGQVFMRTVDSNAIDLKIHTIVPLFVILILSWGTYLYLEYKIGNKVNKYVNCIFIILAIIGVIGISIQPTNIGIDFVSSWGDNKHIEFVISNTHHVFFAFDIISILLFIYISLFVFSKRIGSISFLYVIGYLVYIGCVFLFLYSVIKEFDKYEPFIKALFSLDYVEMKKYSMESCIINPNAYGMVLMIGVIFCCINHSMHKKWWYFLLAVFFLIDMVFTMCRASLFMSIIIMVIYAFFWLTYDINEHKKRNIIILISLSSIFILFTSLFLISYFSNGAILNKIYTLIKGGNTSNMRKVIWDNTYSLISNSLFPTLLVGRGFGLMNEMLLQMNLDIGLYNEFTFPTHNGYLNLFAEGGFIYLFSYLMLLSYYCYVFLKCYKKQVLLSLTVFFGALAFSVYALFESIHYLVYPFMFLMFVLNNVIEKQNNN